jgi:lipopolysaccharide transport system ATP-binding protein
MDRDGTGAVSCEVRVSDLCKVYPLHGSANGEKVALDNISLTIGEGERIGIIGPNGAGKSTLLHLIAGVASPTSGTVEVEGRVHAVLTLGLGLREDLTGRECLYLDGEVQGRTRGEIDRIIDRMVEFAELGDFIDRPVCTYSTGMKSRLAFTGLVHVDPEILIIDEALSVGDMWFGQKAAKAVAELCKRGRIVILVSHSLESVVAMCSRCIWLEHGRIVADGDPEAVTSGYRAAARMRAEEDAIAASGINEDSAQSLDGADRISDLHLRIAGALEPRTVITSGAVTTAHIGVAIDPARAPPEVWLKIDRLDGLAIVKARLPNATAATLDASKMARIAANFGELRLKPGFYQLEAGLSRDGAIVASRKILFKVVSDVAIWGGEPALRAPVNVVFPDASIRSTAK